MRISVFILSLFLLRPSQASNNGKCEITDITDDEWEVFLQPSEKVYDDVNNKVIYQSPYTNKLTDLECICTSDSCKKEYDYIKIENNEAESKFIISTSDHMTDLDADTEKTQQSFIRVVYSCTMKCNTDQTSTLPIYIDIYDKNNHEPEFEEENYNYKVASPIMPVTDFTLYGDSIKAEDLDFSNTEMTFTIEPNDFDITTTVDYNNTKKYIANIRANKALTISSSRIYTLTATDGGTDPGPLNKTVKITIDVDETLSLDFPYFVYPDDNLAAYKFDYDSNENKLIPLTGNITLHTTRSEITDIHLIGEMEDSFEVKFDAASKTFEVSSPATIENPVSPSTALILSLKTDTEASTPIIIQFSNVPTGGVTFKDHSYTGSYDDVNNVVNMNENIELIMKTTKKPTFNITGDLSDNFGVDFDEDTKVCTIKVENKLTPEQISSKTYLTLIIQATVDTDTDKTVIVIQLPVHKLQFTNILYTATYNDDDTVDVDNENPIGFTTDVTDVKITVDEQYSQYFEITDKFAIEVRAPLPADILSSQTELALALTAEDVYGNQPQAVVKMILPLQDTMEAPKFSKPYYTVNYKENATVIDFTDPLSFDNVDDPSTVTITLSEYKKNFNVIFENKKWLIEVTKPLDSNTIDDNSELIITMEAEVKGITAKGVGVLVVLLEKSVGPKFSELSYLAKYEKDQTGSIDFQKPLTFENVEDPSEITITLDTYDEDFEVLYNATTEKWFIKVKKALDSDIFDTASELVIKMTARRVQDNSKTGAAVLVIELVDTDNEEEPKFSDLSYVVKYKKGQTEDVDFTNDVTFKTAEDNKNIKIVLDSYSENFEVYYDQTSNKWKIRVKTKLEDEIFTSNNELIFIMTATNTVNKKSGQTVLIMELIDETNENGIEFTESYYVAQYKQNQTGYVDFDKPISFKDEDMTKISINLDTYSEYFEVTYTSNKWCLHVVKPLDVKIFNDNQELILIMEAEQKETHKTGRSVLVIELIDNSIESKTPQFEEAYYTAVYPSDGKGTVPFDKDINFDNVDDVNKVSISIQDYKDNFQIIYDNTSNKWFIDVIISLDDDILRSNTYLTSTLVANIDDDDDHTPVSAIVLKLPEHDSESAPTFSRSYFKAQYDIDGVEAKVTLEDDIEFSNDVDNNNIEIVADDYSEFLTFEYDTKTKLWQVKALDILDTATLNKSELVVAITATDSDTKLQGRSVIDLKLPKVNTDDAPRFSKTYYKANYDMSTDTATVNLEDPIDILNRIDMSTINITTDEYRDYFQITYEEKWEINVIKNLDQSILNEKVDIIMELIATDKEVTGEIGEATLLITLPAVNNDEVPKFSSIFYESQCNSSTKILETSPIVITNKPDPSDITVAIQEDEYKSNFEIEYNSETNSWQVKVKSLPENEIGNDLVLTLTATETNNNNIGQAALVLNFPPLDPPEFNSIQYYGEYKIVEKSLTVDEVKIVNKQDQKNKIHLVLTDSDRDLSSTFKFSYNDDEDSWEITLNGTLDDGYINGKTQLVLTLTAEEDGNDLTGSATVIISLPTEDKDGNDLTFSELHYEGNYIVNDEPEVQLNRDIHLDSKQDLTNVVFMFNITEKLNANDYLTIEKMSTYGDYVVTVTKSLPADILQNQRSLAVTLHATLGKNEASTTLVINLPIPGEENTIDFSKLLYNGDYSEIDGLAVEEISIITNENSKNIQVDISKDSPYYVYFKVTQSNKIVKLTADNIPSDIIKEISVISLTLTAQSSGTSKTGEAVVNINIRSYQGSAQFDSPLFNGKYEVKENIVTLTVEPITLTTDIEDDLISIAVDNAMVDYLDVSYTSSEVSLQLKKQFPEEFLSNSTIPVLLTGSIKKTDVKTQTVVNLRIITDTQPDNNNILRFDDVLFTAQYSLENGEGKFEQDGDIGLTTNLQADEIDVEISEDSIFGENFGISYANQKVIVHLEKDISTDDFYTNNIISLTMIATTLDNTISTSSVLNIRLNNNGASDNGYISFDKPVYNGNYIVENDLATINYDDITVDTDEEDDNVIASIEEPYDAYFKVTYADKTIKPVLKINQASSVLRDSTNIAVVFCVKIKDTNLVAKTVTNFQVIDKDDGEANDGSIYFPKPVYNGVYNANSDTFTEDDIIIITQHPDTDMEVKMSNEYQYEKYFSVELKNNQVNISLKEKLPKDVVDQLGYIALTIKVTLKSNQKIFAETVLNVEVRGKSRDSVGSNDQKYIIAVSVLSVVLFLVIIGVIAAYFFIFRKSKYEKMSEDEYISSKVKFDKSTLKRGSTDRSRSSALEERRPTGYVFEGNEPRESTTEGPDMERKKSVAFDERVEKMQIGEVNDDDIDKIPKQITEL